MIYKYNNSCKWHRSYSSYLPSNLHLINKVPFDKEIKKQVAGAKTIKSFRCAKTLTKEVQIKVRKYKGLNDDDPSVMQISSVPHTKIQVFQG